MDENWFTKPIKGILLDISGVLKNSDAAIQGSVLGLEMLQNLRIPYKLLTNETTETKKNLVKLLTKLGFRVTEKDIISPIPIVVGMLKRDNLRPYLLVHDEVVEEFISVNKDEENCVVIADAGPNFTYRNLNQAFRLLMEMPNPKLYCLGMGKYYKGDKGLNLDVGTFAKALEFATGVKGTIIGKPSPEYFMFGVEEMGLDPRDVVMIGDDLESDVRGAQACGIRGVLVKTGKFRASDLGRATLVADGVVEDMRNSTSVKSLQEEFIKDDLCKKTLVNPLVAISKTLIDFITQRSGLSIFSFNCQSLLAHNLDLDDTIVKISTVLLLSETHMSNEEPLYITNFNCIVHFKRSQVRAAGVAIYDNENHAVHIWTFI